MATPNVGILTNAGKNLIDQVNAGQTKITFSKIIFSSMNNNQLTDDQIKALTAITPQEIVVNNPEVTLDKNTGETRIRATGNNETLTDGVYVKTYAVFAKDDSGNEILYGITVSPNPNYLPEYDGVTPQAVTYSYKVNISNTSNITFTNSNDVYVSDTDLAEALQPYAKTVDVNQQLDKKVNVSDMRKPASDVVGLEDLKSSVLPSGTDLFTLFNTTGIPKQYYANTNDLASTMKNIPDKEAFTLTTLPVSINYPRYNATILIFRSMFSKNVFYASIGTDGTGANAINYNWTTSVIDNSDGTITLNGKMITPADDSKVLHSTIIVQPSGTDLNTMFTAGFFKVLNGLNTAPSSDNWTIYQIIPLSSNNGVQIAYTTNNNMLAKRTWYSSTNVVFTSWVSFADDYKVAHLSGANNFDTVPTVNNNPLLLASSLPSDLARTGSDQEFTGKNTFDTAPIDKATGNPYITKDGVPAVPSTLADTTKPANFTAGLQSGGVSVATSDDLKSVEESAWRELDLSGTSGIYTGKILIKIDQVNKIIYFMMNAQVPLKYYSKGTKIIDLSNVVTSLTGAHGYLQGWINNLENPYNIAGSTMIVGGSSIELGDDYNSDSTGVSRIATEADPGKQYCYVTYDSLVN